MSATESAGSRHQMAATLQTGMRVLDENQTITFVRYVRLVLPIDGSVFWVRSNLASLSSLLNAAALNEVPLNTPPVAGEEVSFVANGSLHYMTQANQNEADSATLNRVVFTSEVPIENFNEVGPSIMYLGEWQGVRFSFAMRENFYEQAKLWHYVGDAVFATQESQIIDTLQEFDGRQVVSNSLPLWLDLANPYIPVIGLGGLPWPIFPAFLVPSNLPPPFVAVHIFPESTQAISSAPILNSTLSHSQLVREKVRLTTYGLRNAEVLDLCDYVQWQFRNSARMGIMNSPVPRDEHQGQVELGVLAQKKTIEYEVNYLQATARDLARQLILSAFVTYTVEGGDIGPRYGRWNEFRWNDGTLWK